MVNVIRKNKENVFNMWRNDYVHDMGIVIIPEENTYFVKTREESMKDLHSLTSMIGDKMVIIKD